MSYCINPQCGDRCNPNNLAYCQDCGSSLVICDRYRIIKPLRQLDGQHHTEVFEIDDGGIPKILKVLTSNRRRLVELFEQESKVLKQLEHLSISRLDSHFTFVPNHSNQKLRCLVMKKVEGENLKQWLKANGKLTETKAIDWLKQLLAILAQVHQQHILHRDIKPSNIMIRPDGKLILIDFGTARKVTNTYVEKLEDADITRVYSPGYTAPEQLQGQAVFRSDFFALGRTFVYLMTGIYPDDLPKTQAGQLIWHNLAPQISRCLKDLIDRTIALSLSDRPHAGAILNQLNRVSDQPTAIWRNRPLRNWQRGAVIILISSIAIAFCVIGIRHLGWLQPGELLAFDRLMQLRPLENPDSRIVLITVDEADIQYQNQQNMSLRWSLSDEALAQLLVKIKPYQPRTIGIDIYRDFAVDSNYPDLAQELQTSDRLYAVCKVPAPQDGTLKGTPPPPEVPLSRLGFSDFVADSGDVIRRQLLHLTPPAASDCMAEYAFSLQLALNYLNQNGIKSHVTPEGYLQIGTSTFRPISKHSGGYQGIDAAGYQILLNYRSLKSVQNIAQQISLRDILSDRYSSQLQDLIKDRLILIGVIASSSTDDWQTPYSRQSSLAQKQIPGLYIQAQMISQIISSAIDRRPLIWWWSNFWSIIWIWGWALLGGILGWYLRRPLFLGSAIALAQLILFVSCWLIFLQAGWIPLIPAALSLLLTAIATVFLKQRLSQR
ncbi:MAG: hypothetical protein RLZZ574_1893 [Cyanobacteriota bacterium]|jgi:CHASE2 domain-containing sensor protein